MPALVEPAKQKRYVKLRQQGWSITGACREVGVSRDWAYKFERGHSNAGQAFVKAREQDAAPEPIPFDQLGENARRGWDDFEFFRRFYLGHVSTPWQVATAVEVIRRLETPDKEYLIINCPPGVGKTTLMHDIICWAVVRNRAIRVLIGSRVASNASRMLSRVRRSLERTTPAKAKTEDIDRGLAVDAQGTLAADYGAFKPSQDGIPWNMNEATVLQHGGDLVEEKEPTLSSYGRDSGVLSNRFDLMAWDDLVDRTNCRSADQVAELEQHWDSELETRLEPAGVCALVGQLLSAIDLYHHCAAKSIGPDEDAEDEGIVDDGSARPMYDRIKYPAHDDAKCEGVHKRSAARPWPDGCLLDPRRLPMTELRRIKDTKPYVYAVSYQQEDADPDEVLVPAIWVSGGVDPETKEYCPGCWDPKRPTGVVPEGLAPPWLSVATADPSPSRFWALEWWLYHPASEQRFLLDLERRVMEAPDFLDRVLPSNEYVGLMESWQQRSRDAGAPITHWVVERNAAQRFLLQYDHVKKWQAKNRVIIIGHDTHRNKSDPEMGVTSLKPHWRHGRVRLPGDPYNGRQASLKLIEEVTHYPGSRTTDCLMAEWFFEWNLPRISAPDRSQMKQPWRPKWLGKGAAA